MALKMKGNGNPKPEKTIGVDYQQHLSTQPVTGMVSTSKSVKGEEIAGSLSETQTLHPGVFSNGMSIRWKGAG